MQVPTRNPRGVCVCVLWLSFVLKVTRVVVVQVYGCRALRARKFDVDAALEMDANSHEVRH